MQLLSSTRHAPHRLCALAALCSFALSGAATSSRAQSPSASPGPNANANANANALLSASAGTAPTYEIAAGKGQAALLLHAGTGSREAAVSRLVLRSGAEVPEHIHAQSAEFLYVVRGEVVVRIEGKALALKAGDAVRIPAGQKHSGTVPSSVEQAELVQFYVGPGPEQRFTQGKRLDTSKTP